MNSNPVSYPLDPRSEVLPFVPGRVHRLLDVGCAAGGFGHTLRNERPEIEAWGIEADPVSAAQAENAYSRVLVGHFPEVLECIEGEEGNFDCVVFNDVLEHMTDPWAALRAAHEFMPPGGVIVVSIPNMRYWPVLRSLVFSSEWRYAEMGVLDRTHLRWFTDRSLRRTIRECGFEISTFAGLNEIDSRKLRWLERLGGRYVGDVRSRQFVVVASV